MTSDRPHARPVRWLLLALGLVIVATTAVALILFVTREDPQARTVADALRDFRAATTAPLGPESAATPPAGVYQLEGEGREAISFPPVDQADGATMPMTISDRLGDCWTVRIDYNEAHWQEWDLCRAGPTVVEQGGRVWQRWDFGATAVENLSVFTCEPAAPFVDVDAEPGTELERSCTGVSDQVAGTTTSDGTLVVVDRGPVDVGGTSVEAIHVRRHTDFGGAQTGTEDLDLWFSTADALPLRGERATTIDSDSPVGTITYTEEGAWTLRSPTPDR